MCSEFSGNTSFMQEKQSPCILVVYCWTFSSAPLQQYSSVRTMKVQICILQSHKSWTCSNMNEVLIKLNVAVRGTINSGLIGLIMFVVS